MGRPRRVLWWEHLPDERLLRVPLRRLDLRIEGTALEERLAQLHRELERAGIHRFRPYAWLSTSWFTPHGFTGFAVPFYLVHPRLVRLERRTMGDAEGASRETCLRLLRHETAHALDNAYGLHRRGRWREVFGPFGRPYRATYAPTPGSRRFVVNLDNWYAQSHPVEDWAETFAVWLRPGARWRSRYGGWPALRKLHYVEEVVREIADQPPRIRTRERVDPLSELDQSLHEFYRRKRARVRRVRRNGPRREFLR
jgi:hypothetical protein